MARAHPDGGLGIDGKVDVLARHWRKSLPADGCRSAGGRAVAKNDSDQGQEFARFDQATVYGKVALASPATRALYEAAAKARGKPVVSVAIGDFFNPPSVDGVDLSGYTGAVDDEVVIAASDDFEVWRVRVLLSNADGSVIEQGEALESPSGSDRWVYRATAAVARGTTVWVRVTAVDRPGGMDEGVASKEV